MSARPQCAVNPQVIDRSCAPICARDSTGRLENGQTQQSQCERVPNIRRGQFIDERPPETPETGVVCLITPRSHVQILPPLPRSEADSEKGIGLLSACCAWICA